MIRRSPRLDVLIRLSPAAKIFIDDAFAEGREARIEALGTRWILHPANGPRRSEGPEEGSEGGHHDLAQ